MLNLLGCCKLSENVVFGRKALVICMLFIFIIAVLFIYIYTIKDYYYEKDSVCRISYI